MDPPDLGRALGLVSAAALLVMAAVALRLPRRDGRLRILAAFAACWGASAALTNLAPLAETPAGASALYLASVGFFAPLYLFLAYFVASYPKRDGLLVRSGAALGLAVVPAALVGLLMIVEPSALLAGVGRSNGWAAEWGPAYPWLTTIPFRLALAYAVLRHASHARSGATPTLARREALIAAGLATYLAFDAPGKLILYSYFLAVAPSPQAIGFVLAFAAGSFAVLRFFVAIVASPLWPARLASIALVSTAAAVGVAGNALLLLPIAAPSLADTAGWWRLVMIGVVVYAVARDEIPDLAERVSRLLRPSRLVPGAIVLALVAVGALSAYSSIASAVTVGLVLAALVAAAGPVARRLGVASTRAGDETIYQRRVAVYRASLEEALSKPVPDPQDEAWLASLRKGLGISAREHELLSVLTRETLGERRVNSATGVMHGRYRPIRVLGAGGGGQAVLVEDMRLGRQVVIKHLGGLALRDPGAARRLLAESRTIAQLAHPHVVTIHEVGPDERDPYLVMEHCANGSLEDRLRARGPLPLDELLPVLRDVLDGLDAVHARGIVHRDIKPANVLLDASGRAKVSDFGTASRPDPDRTRAVAVTGAIEVRPEGTPAFMSPEQARGGAVDARADLYSVAATAYRLFTGRMPPGASDARPPWLPDGAPDWLGAWIARGLAPDPRARFASAREMRAALGVISGPPA